MVGRRLVERRGGVAGAVRGRLCAGQVGGGDVRERVQLPPPEGARSPPRPGDGRRRGADRGVPAAVPVARADAGRYRAVVCRFAGAGTAVAVDARHHAVPGSARRRGRRRSSERVREHHRPWCGYRRAARGADGRAPAARPSVERPGVRRQTLGGAGTGAGAVVPAQRRLGLRLCAVCAAARSKLPLPDPAGLALLAGGNSRRGRSAAPVEFSGRVFLFRTRGAQADAPLRPHHLGGRRDAAAPRAGAGERTERAARRTDPGADRRRACRPVCQDRGAGGQAGGHGQDGQRADQSDSQCRTLAAPGRAARPQGGAGRTCRGARRVVAQRAAAPVGGAAARNLRRAAGAPRRRPDSDVAVAAARVCAARAQPRPTARGADAHISPG